MQESATSKQERKKKEERFSEKTQERPMRVLFGSRFPLGLSWVWVGSWVAQIGSHNNEK
jgi:hypothetical protein